MRFLLQAMEPFGDEPPAQEPVDVFARRIASHARGIMNAKVSDATPLDLQGPGIALNVMRRFHLPTLELEFPFSLGELIAAVKRKVDTRAEG